MGALRKLDEEKKLGYNLTFASCSLDEKPYATFTRFKCALICSTVQI